MTTHVKSSLVRVLAMMQYWEWCCEFCVIVTTMAVIGFAVSFA